LSVKTEFGVIANVSVPSALAGTGLPTTGLSKL